MKANRWEIKNFLPNEDCADLIQVAEIVGFEQATLDTQIGTITRLEYRNNKRFIFDNKDLADTLWRKLSLLSDANLINPGWTPVGLNERFKIYKYSDPKEFFALHVDGRYLRTIGYEESWVTILIYLNEDFDGGETSFQNGDVKPETGMAVLMTQGNYLHEALSVTKGTKYVLRSDVMYRKV